MNRATKADTLEELLEAAARILPEYTEKLDRLVQFALALWDRWRKGERGSTDDSSVQDEFARPVAPIDRGFDPILKTTLQRLGGEFRGLAGPLREWIHRLSAVHEEGRVTEVQQIELRLRLTDLEGKFQTAQTVFGQLGVL
jgi:hypothetical protein